MKFGGQRVWQTDFLDCEKSAQGDCLTVKIVGSLNVRKIVFAWWMRGWRFVVCNTFISIQNSTISILTNAKYDQILKLSDILCQWIFHLSNINFSSNLISNKYSLQYIIVHC